MAPSASSGRASNKNALPYEQKGRMTWDPVYKAKHQDGASSSESDSDDDFVDGDYPVGPYVSGGLQTGQPTSKAMPARPAPSPTVRVNKIPSNGVTHDGFQRVSYRRPQKHRMPHRVHLNFNRDNTAKAAFRKREQPSGQFVLPRDCNEIEPNRARMYDYFEELGVRLGSFIRPPQHIRDRTLFLWGNTEQISRTGAELLNWLNPTPKAIGSRYQGKENFADIYSVKGDKYKQLQKKIKRDADVRRFQQEPAKGTTFDYTGSFLWPVDEIAPTDLLGAGLEALDPLRIKFQCHIVFDARLTVFKILTNDMESVKRTLARIQGIMKEYVARISRPIVRYYIEPPDPSSYRHDIKNVPSDSLVPKSGSAILPLMTGKPLEPGAYEQWRRQSGSLRAQSDRGIEEALHKTIPHLRFYRGQVRIRVHFGTFALAVFRWPGTAESIAFEDFMKNIAMAGTKGNMIRE